MDKKVVEYKIVMGWDKNFFETLIMDYIRNGWVLLGSPFVHKDQYHQAMVKYD